MAVTAVAVDGVQLRTTTPDKDAAQKAWQAWCRAAITLTAVQHGKRQVWPTPPSHHGLQDCARLKLVTWTLHVTDVACQCSHNRHPLVCCEAFMITCAMRTRFAEPALQSLRSGEVSHASFGFEYKSKPPCMRLLVL